MVGAKPKKLDDSSNYIIFRSFVLYSVNGKRNSNS